MKLIIQNNEYNKNRGFSIILPNFLLKSNFIINIIFKFIKSKQSDYKIELIKYKKTIKTIIKAIYKELKVYTKKYGHFVLVDIQDGDSNFRVTIYI